MPKYPLTSKDERKIIYIGYSSAACIEYGAILLSGQGHWFPYSATHDFGFMWKERPITLDVVWVGKRKPLRA
jgi:hypothetical protein